MAAGNDGILPGTAGRQPPGQQIPVAVRLDRQLAPGRLLDEPLRAFAFGRTESGTVIAAAAGVSPDHSEVVPHLLERHRVPLGRGPPDIISAWTFRQSSTPDVWCAITQTTLLIQPSCSASCTMPCILRVPVSARAGPSSCSIFLRTSTGSGPRPRRTTWVGILGP